MHKANFNYRPMQYKTEPVTADASKIKFPFNGDAVYAEKRAGGGYRLVVAIADVT